TTVPAVNSALQRARKAVPARQPGRTGEERERARRTERPSEERGLGRRTERAGGERELARRYAAAWEAGDVEAIVAMLAEGARYSMPPLPECYVGRDAIRGFLLRAARRERWRFLPARANGQLAFGTYRWDGTRYVPGGLDLLTVRDGLVTEVVSFLEADLTVFGLPAE